MEEAERVPDCIAVIEHGRIVAEGTATALRDETGGRTLEDGFIALTGRSIREDWGGASRPHAHDASGLARPTVSAVFILWRLAAAIEAVFPLARPHDRLARPADPFPGFCATLPDLIAARLRC